MSEADVLPWEPDDDDEEEVCKPGPRRIAQPTPKKVNLQEKITALRGAPKVKVFATVDIESENWEDSYAVGFFGSGKFHSFEGEIKNGKRVYEGAARWKALDDFLAFFLTPEWVGVQTYAHNGGRFDFTFFLERLMLGPARKLGFQTDITPIGSCLFRLTITHPDVEGKWILLDSMRLLPMSLDDMGEKMGVGRKVDLQKAFGCKKGDDVYSRMAEPRHRELMLKYLEQDCRVLHKGIGKYQEIVNAMGGEMKSTTPATSLDIYRRVYHTREIYRNKHFSTCPDLGKDEDKVTCLGCGHAYIRRALAGGRTEIFTMYSKPNARLFYMDFNSMYPSVMLEPMPVGMAVVIEVGGNHDSIMTAARTSIGFIHCDVYIPEDCYLPPLPVKWDGKSTEEAKGGKLVFPTGRFSGVWDTAELALLPLVGGRIEKVRKQVWFQPAPVFGEFIRDMYKFRDKGAPAWSEAWDALAKLMMNSNFGKWAQREERQEMVIHPPLDEIPKLDRFSFKCDVWTRETYVDSDHIAPQLSAHVTSLARARLWRTMFDIVKAGGQLYYCDTDSVIYAAADPKEKPASSNKLGELKHEHTIGRTAFVLPKMYYYRCSNDCPCRFDKHGNAIPGWTPDHLRAKGFGSGLGQKLSLEEFFRLARLDNPSSEPESIVRKRFAQARESIREYEKSKLRFPRVKLSKKSIRSSYDKRDVLADATKTMPLIFDGNRRIIRPDVAIPQENPGKLQEKRRAF